MFLALFWAYVGQPDGHIGWVTLMPFASINPTNPRTNLWNFHKKISRIGDFEKRRFWKMAILKIGHFDFFSSKKIFFFCFILMKISPNLYGRLDGSKFWRFPWFPAIFLLCVIKRYTVYVLLSWSHLLFGLEFRSKFFKEFSKNSLWPEL